MSICSLMCSIYHVVQGCGSIMKERAWISAQTSDIKDHTLFVQYDCRNSQMQCSAISVVLLGTARACNCGVQEYM